MRNILITGGGGYFGTALRTYLSERDTKYFSVDTDPLSPIFKGEHRIANDLFAFRFPSEPIDTIIHLVAVSGEVRSAEKPEETNQINIEGMRRVISLSKKHHVSHIIFPSTASIYDDGTSNGITYSERDTPNPFSIYGKSKLEAEHILESANNQVAITILRKAVIYGSSEKMRYDTMIHSFINSAFYNKKIMLFNKGDFFRPTLALSHALQAYDFVINHKPKKFTIYNVYSENATVLEYAQRIIKIASEHDVDVRIEYENNTHVFGYILLSALPCVFRSPEKVFYEHSTDVWKSLVK